MPLRKIIVEPSEMVFKLPEGLGEQFVGLRRRIERRGTGIIDLGRIDIVFPEKLKYLLKVERSELWGNKAKLQAFELRLKEAIAAWLADDYELKLDPTSQLLLTTGNTPGIFMAFTALFNARDRVFLPDPAYPLYRACAAAAGVDAQFYAVSEMTDFTPNLGKLESVLNHRTKALIVNYPHNPTSKGVDLRFYDKLSAFARKHNLLVLSDSIYLRHSGPGFEHPLYFQSRFGPSTGLEFISFSFLFNLPAYKVGVVLGNAELLGALARVQKNFNFIPSVFDLEITERFLQERETVAEQFQRMFAANRELAARHLDQLGWEYLASQHSPYVWIKLPRRRRVSLTFCRMLLKRTGVQLLPGSLFGEEGEGFVRLALGQPPERLEEAFARINNYSRIYKIVRGIKAARRNHAR